MSRGQRSTKSLLLTWKDQVSLDSGGQFVSVEHCCHAWHYCSTRALWHSCACMHSFDSTPWFLFFLVCFLHLLFSSACDWVWTTAAEFPHYWMPCGAKVSHSKTQRSKGFIGSASDSTSRRIPVWTQRSWASQSVQRGRQFLQLLETHSWMTSTWRPLLRKVTMSQKVFPRSRPEMF